MSRSPDQPEEFSKEQDLLRNILCAEEDFLAETVWDVVNGSYIAFYPWASNVGQNDQSAASRRLAVDRTTKLETLAGNI